MSVDAGLKHLKVISRGEDGGRERVPVSGGHKDSRRKRWFDFYSI